MAATYWITVLAVATALMGDSGSPSILLIPLYLLGLFGHGVMAITSLVTTGCWFHAERGRAAFVTKAGLQPGEGLSPT